MLMRQQLHSGVSYQCKKSLTVLAVKQNLLLHAMRMRETENLGRGKKITELHAWSHPEEKTGVFVMMGSSIGFFSLSRNKCCPAGPTTRSKVPLREKGDHFPLLKRKIQQT